MPKLKTHKGTQKRIKITGSGKLLRRQAFQGHFLSKKSGATKRIFKQQQSVSGADLKNIRKNLGV